MNMGKRAHERAQIVAQGRFRNARGQGGQVSFSDISEQGCRFLDPSRLLNPGDKVTVWIQQVGPFEAQVQWRERGEVGVKFNQALYGPVFDHLKTELARENSRV
ncbi:MAG: hypothetical protein DI637_07815 [Citromicrobium sp.]|nr:MAG: hypothetical protein DI637_07815 [Citromicrobium sp.]